MFVYQPTLHTLELKKEKGPDYAVSWKLEGVYDTKFKPLYTAFFHSIKLSEGRFWIKFDKDPLAAEQNNYLIKILNIYYVYDLDAWPRNPTNNSNLRIKILKLVRNSNKEKYVYIGCGITFDSAGSWSFGNDFARNVITFVVENSSSYHSDNCKSYKFKFQLMVKLWLTRKKV